MNFEFKVKSTSDSRVLTYPLLGVKQSQVGFSLGVNHSQVYNKFSVRYYSSNRCQVKDVSLPEGIPPVKVISTESYLTCS